MKNNKIICLTILGLTALTLGACNSKNTNNGGGNGNNNQSSGGNQSSITYKAGDKIYTERVLFDTNAETVVNPSFKLDIGDKTIDTVKLGRAQIEYGYKNGILTLNGQNLKDAGAGEKTLTVSYTDGSSKKIPALLATKFLYTAEDFQSMNEELTGIYVMAQDIDFSNMRNYEPIGHFTYEEDPDNEYFHGVLDGDGFAIKNLNCSYSDGGAAPNTISDSNYPSNYDVYNGRGKFEHEGHVHGDNIGVFQIIGSSGVVRNLVFDNVYVHGRTIVGIVAGNLSGTAENILIKNNCTALMDTHFWDDDCNMGAAFGIVAGSGVANNIVSLTRDVQIRGTFEDYSDDYIGQSGAGYDHGYNANNPFWRFWGNNKVDSASQAVNDSNGQPSNGVYSVVGKCWGAVNNSIGVKFNAARFDQNALEAKFGQTHVGANKPTSGDANMGELSNCNTYEQTALKQASTYQGFDNTVWNIVDGSYPELVKNINHFEIAE